MARQKNAGEGASGKSDGASATTRPETATRAVVIVPVLARAFRQDDDASQNRPRLTRSPEARHDEAVGLARAIDLDLVHTAIVTVNDPRPATLLGTGKVEEIAEIVKERHAEVVIVDHPLTPVQQRNLEKALNAKVLDRTGADPRDLRPARAHQGRHAAGRSRPSELPEGPAGPQLDPP